MKSVWFDAMFSAFAFACTQNGYAACFVGAYFNRWTIRIQQMPFNFITHPTTLTGHNGCLILLVAVPNAGRDPDEHFEMNKLMNYYYWRWRSRVTQVSVVIFGDCTRPHHAAVAHRSHPHCRFQLRRFVVIGGCAYISHTPPIPPNPISLLLWFSFTRATLFTSTWHFNFFVSDDKSTFNWKLYLLFICCRQMRRKLYMNRLARDLFYRARESIVCFAVWWTSRCIDHWIKSHWLQL